MKPLEFLFFNHYSKHYHKIEYHAICVDYVDGFTGELKQYYPSFTVTAFDNTIEHIEILPASLQMPLTQFLYAQNNLNGWRMINKDELIILGCEDCYVPTWW